MLQMTTERQVIRTINHGLMPDEGLSKALQPRMKLRSPCPLNHIAKIQIALMTRFQGGSHQTICRISQVTTPKTVKQHCCYHKAVKWNYRINVNRGFQRVAPAP